MLEGRSVCVPEEKPPLGHRGLQKRERFVRVSRVILEGLSGHKFGEVPLSLDPQALGDRLELLAVRDLVVLRLTLADRVKDMCYLLAVGGVRRSPGGDHPVDVP